MSLKERQMQLKEKRATVTAWMQAATNKEVIGEERLITYLTPLVYLLKNKSDEVLYVGASRTGLHSPLLPNHYGRQARDECETLTLLSYRTYYQAEKAAAALTKELRPKYNKYGAVNKYEETVKSKRGRPKATVVVKSSAKPIDMVAVRAVRLDMINKGEVTVSQQDIDTYGEEILLRYRTVTSVMDPRVQAILDKRQRDATGGSGETTM